MAAPSSVPVSYMETKSNSCLCFTNINGLRLSKIYVGLESSLFTSLIRSSPIVLKVLLSCVSCTFSWYLARKPFCTNLRIIRKSELCWCHFWAGSRVPCKVLVWVEHAACLTRVITVIVARMLRNTLSNRKCSWLYCSWACVLPTDHTWRYYLSPATLSQPLNIFWPSLPVDSTGSEDCSYCPVADVNVELCAAVCGVVEEVWCAV